MSRPVPRLHAVTNQTVIALPDLAARAERIAAAGADAGTAAIAAAGAVALHARAGRVDAVRVVELGRLLCEAGATVLVNDRVDAVVAAGAAGVHLPADGLPVDVARSLLGSEALIGRSTHSPEEARGAAEAGADYVFLGPIWETPSHPGAAALGPAALEAAAVTAAAPVIAIGGVTPERARIAHEAGAWGAAAISALWLGDDPEAAARVMLLSFV